MNEALLFDETGEPNAALVIRQPDGPRRQDGAGAVNRSQVHRETKPTHSGQRLRILKHIEKMADCGATREEISDALGLPLSSVCGRVNQLLDQRWPDVVETDQRRNTKYGKPAVVVVAKSYLDASCGKRDTRS